MAVCVTGTPTDAALTLDWIKSSVSRTARTAGGGASPFSACHPLLTSGTEHRDRMRFAMVFSGSGSDLPAEKQSFNGGPEDLPPAPTQLSPGPAELTLALRKRRAFKRRAPAAQRETCTYILCSPGSCCACCAPKGEHPLIATP
eukprot:gene24264-biopygen5904